MREQIEAWEEQYASPGPLWRGPSPAFTVEGDRVLELGCGNGKTLSSIGCDFDVVGLDYSINALNHCPTGPHLVRGNILHLPFKDKSFDTVLLHHVIQHLMMDDRIDAVKEVLRVLRPNGLLSVRTFSIRDLRFGKGIEIENNTFRRGNGIIYHYFELNEFNELFSSFETINIMEVVKPTRFAKSEVRAELTGTFRRPK
ncbi:MAG: class I SAM-dependent methyltransferase [Euryarchaeota archaeon]|nr:class I SAM-dependent methyltransferase [Euryarchaeota archaeon]